MFIFATIAEASYGFCVFSGVYIYLAYLGAMISKIYKNLENDSKRKAWHDLNRITNISNIGTLEQFYQIALPLTVMVAHL